MAYSVVDVNDLPGEGPGGVVRKVRKALDARAFGFNYFELPPGAQGREHDHAHDGHEEVYVVVRGSGVMRVDGDDVPLKPGVFVRVDPETTRMPVAGDEGVAFVTFGRAREGDYSPPSWE